MEAEAIQDRIDALEAQGHTVFKGKGRDGNAYYRLDLSTGEAGILSTELFISGYMPTEFPTSVW